jgi:hypothetical protein
MADRGAGPLGDRRLVPYGFLLPERDSVALIALIAAVIAAGALVWAASRLQGIVLATT